MLGKQKRLNSILFNGKAIMVPMDHGLSDGPVKGLVNMDHTINEVVTGGASAVIIHKGIIKSLKEVPSTGLILHASGGTSVQLDTNNKVLVANVEEALRLGADAISLHINIGGAPNEPAMVQKLAHISEQCDSWNIPLLAMMYPRGKNITNALDVNKIALVARVGAELGADIVKTIYTGDVASFEKVVEGCPVPVVVAGGPKLDNNKDVLQMVADVMEAGAIGVTLGRNIFQHSQPRLMTKAVKGIISHNWSVEKALDVIESEQPINVVNPVEGKINA